MNFKLWNIFGNVFDGVLVILISFEMFLLFGCFFNRDVKNVFFFLY